MLNYNKKYLICKKSNQIQKYWTIKNLLIKVKKMIIIYHACFNVEIFFLFIAWLMIKIKAII